MCLFIKKANDFKFSNLLNSFDAYVFFISHIKECHLNKMIKEAIGYVNKIVQLTENINISDEDTLENDSTNDSSSLKDIHLNSQSQDSKKGTYFS